MYRRSEVVSVVRKPFITREKLVDGRFLAKLELSAKVPNDSYLFIWSGEGRSKQYTFIKELREKLAKIPLKELERRLPTLIAEWEGGVKSKRLIDLIKSPPSYGNTYIIPASSIKGAIRSRLEYKLKPIRFNDRLLSYACYIVQEEANVSTRHKKFWGEDATLPREGPCDVSRREDVCIVCDLFGCPSLAGRVSLSDAELTEGGLEELNDLGIKAFRPNSSFKITCSVFNANWSELGLLFTAMELQSCSPILVGYKKYIFNKQVGELYNKRFSFGLLSFSLKHLTLFDASMKKREEGAQEALKTAFESLKQTAYFKYLDLGKGLMKL